MRLRVPLALATFLVGAATFATAVLWAPAVVRGLGAGPWALTVAAVCFLGGLGLGAGAVARRGAGARPGRAAALCALAAGAFAGLSTRLLDLLPAFSDAVASLLGAAGPLVAPLAASLLFLLPGAFLFGASLPLLVAAAGPSRAGPGAAGWLLGACAGVLGGTLGLAAPGGATGRILAGLLFLLAAAACLGSDRERTAQAAAPLPAVGAPWRALAFVVGVAGAVALLAWSRFLIPLLGPSLPSFAALLGAALLAASAGALAAALASRAPRGAGAVSLVLTVAGLCLPASILAAGALPALLLVHAPPADRLAGLLLGTLAVVLPGAAALGAAWPLLARAGAGSAVPPGRATADVFAWQALGLASGVPAASFLLLPAVGAPAALLLAAALLLLAASLLQLARGGRRGLVAAVLVVAPLALLSALQGVPPLLRAGPRPATVAGLEAPLPPGLSLDRTGDAALFAETFAAADPRAGGAEARPSFREGFGSTVGVLEEPGGALRLVRDGETEAYLDGGTRDAAAWALGVLPVALHPDPDRVLVIGLGAGLTAEAASAAGARSVDVAEADDALRRVVEDWRGRATGSRPARIVREDGRVLLRRTPAGRPWSAVVLESGRPWEARTSHLLTLEALEAARGALAADGVFAQRLDLRRLPREVLRSCLATLLAVFPEAWGFRFGDDLLLVASARRLRADPERWDAAFRRGGREEAGLSEPPDLWRHFAIDTAGLRALAIPGTPLLTDDRLLLEPALAGRRVPPVDPMEARRLLEVRFPPNVDEAVADPATRDAWRRRAVESWVAEGRLDLARGWVNASRWGLGGPDGKRARARLAEASGDLNEALALLRAATEEAPGRGDVAAERIRLLAAASRPSETPSPALQQAIELAARFPDDGRVQAALARAYQASLFYNPSRDAYRAALRAKDPPAPPGTGTELARLLLAGGEAEGEALAALRADPSVPDSYDGLDLLVRLEAKGGDTERWRLLRDALETLEAREGDEARRRAAEAVASGRWIEAEADSAQAVALRPRDARAWETRALALLGSAERVYRESFERAQTLRKEAGGALARAVAASEDREAARRRAGTILRWYGVDAADLEAALAAEAAGP